MMTWRLRGRVSSDDLKELEQVLEKNFGPPTFFHWNLRFKEDVDIEHGGYFSRWTGKYIVKLKFWRREDYLLYRLLRQETWP